MTHGEPRAAHSSFLAVIATAVFVSSLLLTYDMLLGTLMTGARGGLSETGPAPVLVDVIGLTVYLALCLVPAVAIFAIGRRSALAGRCGALWLLTFGAPLWCLAALYVGLGVGRGSSPVWVGGDWVTAVVVAAIAGLPVALPNLRAIAVRTPGSLAL